MKSSSWYIKDVQYIYTMYLKRKKNGFGGETQNLYRNGGTFLLQHNSPPWADASI